MGLSPVDAAIEAAYTLDPTRATVVHLVEIVGVTTYRYTDAVYAPITWGGFTWANLGFELSEISMDASGEQSCSVTFEDASRTLRTLTFSENLSDREVKIYEAWLDPAKIKTGDIATAVIGAQLHIQGVIDGMSCSGEDSAQPLALMNVRGVYAASMMAIGPTQDAQRNCRYAQFKGEECLPAGVLPAPYAAATTCDRQYATCALYLNTQRFGGFRWALGENETVVWGTVRGVTTKRPDPPYQPPATSTGTTTLQPVKKRRAVR